MTTIVYIGNFEPSHSTENHYASSFEALGHVVVRAQEPSRGPGSRRFLRQVGEAVARQRADLLLYTRTWGLPPESEQLWRDVEQAGCITAAVHLDRWMGLGREHEVREQTMFRMGHVFTADGDAGPMYEAAGVNHHWLRAGVYKPECYDSDQVDARWVGKRVAFVGSAPTERGGNYHDEWPHRRILVEQLRDWYGDAFVHIGNGGDYTAPDGHQTLRGDDLNRFYRTVPVIVGDSCFAERGTYYWSDRAYETWGRGGFLIHPYIEALEYELGSYPSWHVGRYDELRAQIDRWLSEPNQREDRRVEMARHVRAACTYENRATEMLTVLGLT